MNIHTIFYKGKVWNLCNIFQKFLRITRCFRIRENRPPFCLLQQKGATYQNISTVCRISEPQTVTAQHVLLFPVVPDILYIVIPRAKTSWGNWKLVVNQAVFNFALLQRRCFLLFFFHHTDEFVKTGAFCIGQFYDGLPVQVLLLALYSCKCIKKWSGPTAAPLRLL